MPASPGGTASDAGRSELGSLGRICHELRLLLWADCLVVWRDTAYVKAHLVNAIVIGLLIGGVYFQLDSTDYQQ